MKRKIILKGKYCQLVRLDKSDLSFIKKWRNGQREVLRQNKILTDTDQISWYKILQHDKNQKIFSIVDGAGNLLGYCGITHIDWINQRGELSFLLKTEISKVEYKKFFLDALGMLKKYCLFTLRLHKFFAETFSFRKFHINILEEFGFKRSGIHWIDEQIGIFIEVPGDYLAGRKDKITTMTVEGLKVYIIGIEDLIIDRLAACHEWKSDTDCKQAHYLLRYYQSRVDFEYLTEKAKDEGLLATFKKFANSK